jgi:hypothetical protein
MQAFHICLPLFMHRTNILTPTLLVATAWAAQAAVSFTGSPYTQNFDTLPNAPINTSLEDTAPWIDDVASPSGQTSLLGWYLYHPLVPTTPVPAEDGVNGHQRFRIHDGSSSTGGFHSFGSSGATDRALGNLAVNALGAAGTESYIGLRLHNDTGATISSFALSYSGEQWRNGGVAATHSLTFGYSTTATSVQDAAFTSVAELTFTSPVTSTTAAAVDGNVAGRTVISAVTVNGLTWAPGTDLWLRWADKNDSGNDHGLAIDDLTFTAVVPEPGSAALIGLGVLAFGLLRRKNK